MGNWQSKRAIARIPNLVTTYNNGVRVVVRTKDYEAARSAIGRAPTMLIISPALTFSDSINPRVRQMVTGTMEDFRALYAQAYIKDVWGIYVPYTSGLMSREEEDRLFPHITREKATEIIWEGFRR
jgi:hypothetical protein